ncbi:MAG: diguanylate cyclase [Isosphaeraceae bacterium]
MKILIVDDSRFAALRLRKALERMGYETTIESNGDEVRRLVETGRFPIVFAALKMPGLDGLELCRRVRERRTIDPIYLVLLTSRSSPANLVEALEAGADDFLATPIEVQELHARIQVARRILELQAASTAHSEEIRRMSLTLEQRNRELSESAAIDRVTGLKNRRFFHEALDSNYALSSRTGLRLSLIMIQVDEFQRYTDDFGLLAGNSLLIQLAGFLTRAIREHDLAARLEEEQFVLLLPATDADDARNVAERVRTVIAEHQGSRRLVTATFGVATTHRDIVDSADLLEQAQLALEHCKRSGGNRVAHSKELERFGVLKSL